MTSAYVVTTEPASEPITLEQLKDSLRVSGCDFDAELTEVLKSARKRVEQDALRKLVMQTVTLYMDCFPGGDIELRLAPVSAVNSVKYYDLGGTQQTLAVDRYWTDLKSTPPRISLRSGYSWPSTQLERPHAVEVEFVAGYGTAAAVDQTARLAIREAARMAWSGCDASETAYQRLVAAMSWTGYKVAMS